MTWRERRGVVLASGVDEEEEGRKQRGNLACTSPEGIAPRGEEGKGTEQKTNLSCCCRMQDDGGGASQPAPSLPLPSISIEALSPLSSSTSRSPLMGLDSEKRLCCLCSGRYIPGAGGDGEVNY